MISPGDLFLLYDRDGFYSIQMFTYTQEIKQLLERVAANTDFPMPGRLRLHRGEPVYIIRFNGELYERHETKYLAHDVVRGREGMFLVSYKENDLVDERPIVEDAVSRATWRVVRAHS